MAFNLSSGDSDIPQEQHDINVTPFIDVILVLLIIFMVAAPLATVDLPVQLPKVAAEPKPRQDKPVYLTLQQDLALTLGEDVRLDNTQIAQALMKNDIAKTRRILLRVDTKVEYGAFIYMMNQLAVAGYDKVALVGLEAPEKS